MKRILLAATLALVSLSGTGCSYVTSGLPSTTTATGDAWYTRDNYFLFFLISSNVYYCPKDNPTHCTKAVIK